MKAVLFDFSGTLLRIESTRSWVDAVLGGPSSPHTVEELRHYADLLERAGALPGGADPLSVPPAVAGLWATRDESAELHRSAYTGLSRQVALPDDALHDALYARHMLPEAWQPYPDTAEVLGALRARGIPVAVVSNIGWDLRPVFRAHDLDRFVDAYVLSYEYGVQKPDPRLFRTACAALGQEPAHTLMVGDSRHADGGAAALGCAVHFVDHLPAAERPDGLRPVLDLLDPCGTRP
ncbi:HAD-IA family hydrolase [Streptomyces sp. NBC_00237]|uniref:HAD family hydrolase n=1 Tax=Streptomyces sp. NBC_00237 TaxID=2975687 RepID=UPI00225BAFA4|nr:HAD-IA family hydrolase [Streptomyces sp. NBC_00237]MCX5207064.1 HAD-IA family hydrolase [Streptomyces sp. NBC_00237]